VVAVWCFYLHSWASRAASRVDIKLWRGFCRSPFTGYLLWTRWWL